MTGAYIESRDIHSSWKRFRLLPAFIWIPLIAVLLTSVGVAVFSEWSAQHVRVAATHIEQVLHRLGALADLKGLMSDVQTGERGYLLTHERTDLEPFTRALQRLPAAERMLRELSTTAPQAGVRLARIQQLIDANVAGARAVIDTFDAGRPAAARQLLRSTARRHLMERFRTEVAAFDRASRDQLYALQRSQADNALWSRISLILMTLVSLGLLFIVARLIVLDAQRRESRRSAAEREARQLERLVETRTRELSALSTHLQQLTEKEKSELAHNLHDELGGLLTAAKMDLSWLLGRVEQRPAIQQRLQQLGGVLDEAMDVKRRVVEDLRPSLLDHFGLPAALRAYLESACGKAGLQCEVIVADDETVPKDIAIALFRVVQEGLTNVIRHAQAHTVRLQLAGDEHHHVLELSDDGRGMDLAGTQLHWSHGITGMRHRIRALGGRFVLQSAPGRGTTLRVEVPRTAAAAGSA